MKTRYKCAYCDEQYSDRTECIEHEPKCYENPASRSCETCMHHDTVVAGTGKVWNTCRAGLLTSPRWVENHATGCPQWHRETTEENDGNKEDFHQHLDECKQCRNNPFALCAKGHMLLISCVPNGEITCER